MNTFYASIDNDSVAARFCVQRSKDGKLIARCDTEDWSCAIRDALNTIDKIVEQTKEMETWPS